MIRPEPDKGIRVVYNEPKPYVVVNAGLSSGQKINNLILTPEEAKELSRELRDVLGGYK